MKPSFPFHARRSVLLGLLASLLGAASLAQRAAPRSPGGGERLSAPLVGVSVKSFLASPDGSWVVYRADQDLQGKEELFAVPARGGEPPRKISGQLPANRDVKPGFVFSPDSRRVIYLANAFLDQDELFGTLVDGSAPPVRLTPGVAPAIPHQEGQPAFLFSPDASRVLFYRNLSWAEGLYGLFSVPLDGSGPPVRLDDPTLGGALLPHVFPGYVPLLTPDSHGVVFALSTSTGSTLVRAAVDGGSPLVDVLAGRPAFTRVSQPFTLDPDGVFLLFLADGASDEVFELFATPLDVGWSPARLSAPLAAGDDVLDFQMSPTGSLVYRTTLLQDVFGVSLDGSGVLQLSASGLLHGPVDSYKVAPDGKHVAYSARAPGTLLGELHGVPLDGSRPAVRLSESVFTYVIDATSRSVVYSDSWGARSAVFSVPIDGSGVPVRLSSALERVRVPGFRVSSDARWVLYNADEDVDELYELFVAPIDGRRPARKLNGPLVSDDVFDFDSLGGRALYRARELSITMELFAAPLEIEARKAP